MFSRRSSGFTLIEVLVVLTIISLISVLLFQGYGYLLGSYQRLKSRQQVEAPVSILLLGEDESA